MTSDPNRQTTSNDSPLNSVFERLVKYELEKWKVPGISIAVVDGERTFAKGYGIAAYPNTPVTPETLFFTGSTTKAFTAAAYSLLVDDDEKHPEVNWTTPISDLTPEDFVLSDDYWTKHITVEDALVHRTGLSGHDKSYGGKGYTSRDIVRSLRHLPIRTSPRTSWDYCNIMYVAISHAIEVITGENLGDFMKRRIWKPLGMDSTYFSLADAKASEKPLAKGYKWLKGVGTKDGRFTELPFMVMPEVAGAGVMISNVLDYTCWLRCLIRRGEPLSESVHLLLTKPIHTLDNGLPPSFSTDFYALGWQVRWYHGEKVVWHEGALKGFGALTLFLPNRSWGCIMFGNRQLGANFAEMKLAWYLIDELLEVPETERFDFDIHHEKEDCAQESVDDARDRLFPNSSDVAHSVPLESYMGSYFHPAYQIIDLTIKDEKLHADVLERTWPYVLDFMHVSGEHFMLWIDSGIRDKTKASTAKFEVGSDGNVKRMGLVFENNEVIAFERIRS